MSVLTATDLAKSIGPLDVFAGISLSIPHHARIGLVGPNGVGKTTLLRILAGEDAPTDGEVHRARSLEIGYLPQEANLTASHTLLEECRLAFTDLRAMETELVRLERAMADPKRADAVLEQYGPLQELFERRGGYTYTNRMEQVLSGLGFTPDDHQRPLSQLSGGQRTRALLARLLLSDPDLLILDEPTNHLDIDAVEWLESYLREWRGAAVIVSHDRYFLDRVVNVIWEMGPLGFEVYRGGYSAYIEQRQSRWDHRRQIFDAELARLEKDLDFIRRNIAGQGTLQAKGRLRRLSRQVQAIEQLGAQALQGRRWARVSAEIAVTTGIMGVDEAGRRLNALRLPADRPGSLKMRLRFGQRSGDLVLRSAGLVIGYPDDSAPLFNAPDLLLRRGECAAVLGPNGAGKTTFLKTLLGQVPPLSGQMFLGASLQVGYFAQAHSELRPERTLMDEIHSSTPHLLDSEVRSYLARYQFTGDEVYKRVAELSGGERARLALARLALSDANLLLLDEPTNQLDIPSQETLQTVLADYEGTVLLVSHDRYLIDALADQIWAINAHQGTLTVFPGTYSQYQAHQRAAEEASTEPQTSASLKQERPGGRAGESGGRRRTGWRRKIRLQEVEKAIEALEARLARLSQSLETPPPGEEEVVRLGEEYVAVKADLDRLLAEWEELQTS